MRVLLLILVCSAVLACQPAEPETYQASANLRVEAVPDFLRTIDKLVDNDLDVGSLVMFGSGVPVNHEQQQLVQMTYQGETIMVLYHVRRENADNVQLKFSTPSEQLAAAIAAEM